MILIPKAYVGLIVDVWNTKKFRDVLELPKTCCLYLFQKFKFSEILLVSSVIFLTILLSLSSLSYPSDLISPIDNINKDVFLEFCGSLHNRTQILNKLLGSYLIIKIYQSIT